MKLTQNQQLAINIEKNICVTAGAGSGKTTVLVARYIEILKQGKARPREIVAITFTEKAAAEMKGRIIDKIKDMKESDLHETFLEEMNVAPISTIHAFCSRILREFPFQAGIPANFSILQGFDQTLQLRHTIKNTLDDIASNPKDSHYTALKHSLQRYNNRAKLTELFSTMVGNLDMVSKLILERYNNSDNDIYDYWNQHITNRWLECLPPVLNIAQGPNAPEVKVLTTKLSTITDSIEAHKLRRKIADLITTKSGKIAKTDFIGRGIDITGNEKEIKFLENASTAIKSNAPSENNFTDTDDHYLIDTTKHLFSLYKRILNDYQHYKLSQGKLDFEDLQLKTRDLLKNNHEIQKELINRYKYYMVDEYQDTNKLQHELVKLLTNNLQVCNVFIVGDPKQSIYGFRGADVRVFNKTQQQIKNEGEKIILSENFRSLRNPLAFTNFFFEQLMGEGQESEYEVEFESLTKARNSDSNGIVEILLGDKRNDANNEYTLIAQHIKNLIANSENKRVQGDAEDASSQPIHYGDFAILIRSRRHLPEIEQALIAADIPYLTTGGVGFYQRQEIYDIWNYISFLNNPTKNDTSLIGVLRGPAFAIADTELFEISRLRGDDFWHKAQNYQNPSDKLIKAITILKNHKQIAMRTSVSQLIITIVNQTGLIGTLKIGHQGQQKWANYQKLLDLARSFDGDEDRQTLSDFIEFLDILITEEPREGQAPIEESCKAVQIMTIHSAKGKEFPIVILPSLNRTGRYAQEPFIDDCLGIGFSPRKPEDTYTKTAPEIITLMKDRANAKDLAEKKRIFYVGATRARDRLILSGSLNAYGKSDNILKWLFENLEINHSDDAFSKQGHTNEYSNERTETHSHQLNIPIIKQLDNIELDKMLDEPCEDGFSIQPISKIKHKVIPASFSITELANYSRCPLRYQLENVLQIQPVAENKSDKDDAELESTILRVLSRIQHPSHIHNPDSLIGQTIKNITAPTGQDNSSDLYDAVKIHIRNFTDTELAQNAISASETFINHKISADIQGHIISGKFDRLFFDQTGQLHAINFVTSKKEKLEYYKHEMELMGLLIHRSFPNIPQVTINYFFTKNGNCEKMCIDKKLNSELSTTYIQDIDSLQQNKYIKNLNHCSFCIYSDSLSQCIVTET